MLIRNEFRRIAEAAYDALADYNDFVREAPRMMLCPSQEVSRWKGVFRPWTWLTKKRAPIADDRRRGTQAAILFAERVGRVTVDRFSQSIPAGYGSWLMKLGPET